MKNKTSFVAIREDSSIILNLSKYRNNKYVLLMYLEKTSKNFSRSHKQTFGQKKLDLLYKS